MTRNPFTPALSNILALAFALLTATHALAAEDLPKPEKLFASTTTLKVKISAPWRDLERNERYQGAYTATIEYTDGSKQKTQIPLTVERRGVKRQQTCDFPPIKLRFEKADARGTVFRGQKSLKMVTHCEAASRFEQYYMLEMLAYRMYNVLTDFSFKVRPLSVTYHDSENGRSDEDRFAFLIEDDGDVAERNGLKKLEIPSIRPSRLDRTLISEFSLFQYMIGNVDWAALSGPDPNECCHNVKLIAPRPLKDDDIIYAIPYDFDSAGIVDAPYAAPPNGLPIRNVTQRLYRGYCLTNDTLPAAREKFLANEAAILAVLDEEPRLRSSIKNKARNYLERFFETLRDDRDWEKEIIEKCRR